MLHLMTIHLQRLLRECVCVCVRATRAVLTWTTELLKLIYLLGAVWMWSVVGVAHA